MKLRVLLMSALTLEFIDSEETIIGTVVSSKLYFVNSGKVNVYYRQNNKRLLHYERGCYFGDISLLFKI